MTTWTILWCVVIAINRVPFNVYLLLRLNGIIIIIITHNPRIDCDRQTAMGHSIGETGQEIILTFNQSAMPPLPPTISCKQPTHRPALWGYFWPNRFSAMMAGSKHGEPFMCVHCGGGLGRVLIMVPAIYKTPIYCRQVLIGMRLSWTVW